MLSAGVVKSVGEFFLQARFSGDSAEGFMTARQAALVGVLWSTSRQWERLTGGVFHHEGSGLGSDWRGNRAERDRLERSDSPKGATGGKHQQ